jgi:probable rRNA maturation factor
MSDDRTIAAIVTDPEIDIDLRCALWRDELSDVEGLCRRAAASALAVARTPPAPVEISLVLADDAFVQALNRSWRNEDSPTNVLAFPCDDGPAEGAAGRLLGDVVVAYQTTAREAAEGAIRLDHHLAHLVVHGVLHLLGYDHLLDEEAGRMERLEAAALARLGIADPYDERSVDGRDRSI